MKLLNTIARVARSHDHDVAEVAEPAPTATEETDDLRAFRASRLGSENEVIGVAGSGKEQHAIARFRKCFDGAREDVIESVIVPHAAHVRRIGEGDRGERNSIVSEAPRELFGDVHRIRQAASVARRHEFASGLEAIDQGGDDRVQSRFLGSKNGDQAFRFVEGGVEHAVHAESVLGRGSIILGMNSFGPVAAHYDRLMDTIPYRMWTSYLLLLFAKQGVKPRKLLDVCCGTGSMCHLLADEDFQMTGFDLSEGMIEEAKSKDHYRQMAGKEPVRFEVADAATFELNDTFEAAYSFFDSLNYITEPELLQSAFHRISAHLEPGASFIFDLNTAYAFEERMFDQQSLKKGAPLRYRWRGHWDPDTRIIEVEMKFWAHDEEFREVHRQRAYSDEEIRAMLKRAGFVDIEWFHSYTLDKPRPTSDRVHYACRKRA